MKQKNNASAMNRFFALPHVKKFPGKNARAWTNYHLKYGARSTYLKNIVRDRTAPAIGPFFTDVDGNVFLDFVSHVAFAPLGYNHEDMIDFISTLPIEDPSRYAGADFICATSKHPSQKHIPTPSDLHYKMMQITKKFGFGCSFFSNSGAEAIENAMKICFLKRGVTKHFFSFDGAFHGRTLGALTLTRSKQLHRSGFPHLAYGESLPFCSCKNSSDCRCGWKIVGIDGKIHNALSVKVDSAIGMINPKETAFVIIEPVQGEGGYRIANSNFIKELVGTAHDAQIPVIFDEIQSGMGRTGKWWAAEHYKVRPDIITCAKALRIGATIGRKELFPNQDGKISGTWSEGNALASAVGYKTIEIIEQEKLLKNAEKTGNYFVKRLKELEGKLMCSNARGLGLMTAIDFVDQKTRDAVVDKCNARGLVVLGAGYKSMRFIPPLNVNKREIDLCVDILANVIKK